jgi:hypothetical protein
VKEGAAKAKRGDFTYKKNIKEGEMGGNEEMRGGKKSILCI